jgi:uncharacterized coiled-coil protein SlyX
LLRKRVKELEVTLSNQNFELEKTATVVIDQRQKLDRLQTELNEKQRIIQELIQLQSGNGDSVSGKIMSEIQQTQKAYQETADELEQRSRFPHNSSATSVTPRVTTGTDDCIF